MAQASKKRKRVKRKYSIRKIASTGIIVLVLAILSQSIIRSIKLFIKEGFEFNEVVQTENLLNFGVPLPSGYKVHGIDISHHQKHIKWSDVASIDVNGTKICFAFIKATEGITRHDNNFTINWKNSKKAGIMRGAYHFYYPTRDAVKQANNFINHVKLEPGDLPPVLDIELSKGKSKDDIVKGCREWCNTIEEHYGVKPIIYTNPTFYDKYLKDDFEDYPLWIAHYHKELPRMHHRDWIFWQHTDRATITGISKPVDLNVFNGSLRDLSRHCIK
jgi:lysozyme